MTQSNRNTKIQGFFIADDFNTFPDKFITISHDFKQVVTENTREKKILDKCFTNCAGFCHKIRTLPNLGKSDHTAVVCEPNINTKYNKGKRVTKIVRVSGKNEKAMFVHNLQKVNWTELYRLDSCKDQFAYFDGIMSELIDAHFPLKTIVSHTKDKPWVTQYFKTSISERQSDMTQKG